MKNYTGNYFFSGYGNELLPRCVMCEFDVEIMWINICNSLIEFAIDVKVYMTDSFYLFDQIIMFFSYEDGQKQFLIFFLPSTGGT